VFAQLGQRTLLIDASLRSPALHAFFKLDPSEGLSTALAGRNGLDCARAIGAMPGLQVMPAGPQPPNPLELIEQARFSQLLDYAAAQFEAVIIDTPANAEGPDAALLANRAGSAVLVVRADATRQAEARRFALALEQARTNVLGLVFNEKR
jgi:receptor protein-tyrosine kinase